MMKNIIFIIILVYLVITSGCSDDPAFDILLGGQPRFITEDGYDKKLNVFGVLRPELIENYSQSFIHLERTLAAVNDIENGEEINITDATVRVMLYHPIEGIVYPYDYGYGYEYYNPDSAFNPYYNFEDYYLDSVFNAYSLDYNFEHYSLDSANGYIFGYDFEHLNPVNAYIKYIIGYNFEYQNPDSAFKVFEYRNTRFFPYAHQKCKLICERMGYETITAETIIPNKPQISGNISVQNNTVKFNLVNNPSIFLYDIYLFDRNEIDYSKIFDFSRILPSEDTYTNVMIQPEFEITDYSYLVIYSYDINLATYMSYSNNFIKPGTYRPPITTVEGGYGCFGSMNFETFRNFY